ncbi:MAG: hypothetical protein ACR2PR_06925, partial [Pseudohongiellaceae bacterium]
MVDPVTKLPNGYTTEVPGTFAGDTLVLPNPAGDVKWFDDFLFFSGAGAAGVDVYTSLNVGGANDAALLNAAAEPSGVVRVTSVNGQSDEPAIQLNNAPFAFSAGKQLWFEARVRVPNLDNTAWEVGLQTINASFVARNGIVLAKTLTMTGNVLSLFLDDAGELQTFTEGRVVADVWTRVAFHYDGNGTVNVYQDGRFLAAVTDLTNLPLDTLLAPTFLCFRGDTTTRTADLDYFNILAER